MAGKQLHICIVTGDFPALTETFITNKVLELTKRGHRITVIKNNNSGTNKTHLKLVKDAGVEILKMPSVYSVKDLIKSPSASLKAFSFSKSDFKTNYRTVTQLALLKKYKFDIVHFEFSGIAIFYLETIKKITAKTVVSCRGTAEKVKPLSDVKRKANLKEIFSVTDKIHCVSEDMSSTIQLLGAGSKKIFVNPPSIDTEIFKRTHPYNQNISQVKILSIGRLTFQKGYMVGLLAMKNLKNSGVDFLWNIVGDGPQMEELLFHINELKLTDFVKLTGKKNRDEILQLYNSTDIFFLPSVYEGIANVCLEAMSMEIPVVSSDCSGMGEVIKHDVNGMLAANYNYNEMAEHLSVLCNDNDKRKSMGIKAGETIRADFNLGKQVDVFEQHYYNLVEGTS